MEVIRIHSCPPPNFVAASLKACTFNANGLSTLVRTAQATSTGTHKL